MDKKEYDRQYYIKNKEHIRRKARKLWAMNKAARLRMLEPELSYKLCPKVIRKIVTELREAGEHDMIDRIFIQYRKYK